MEFIRGIYNIKPFHHGCVATIGNFDGLHLGHQQVIQNLQEKSKQLNLPSLLITFEPLALEYFQAERAPARLMRLREKLMQLQKTAIDRVLCLHFNKSLADLSAEDFVKDVLVKKLGIRHLIIGDDFQFGKQRQGDIHLLKILGKVYHFEVSSTASFVLAGERVGSSRVRMALANSDWELAKQLLGHSYFMSGRVIHGDKRGRQLGFPTANILLKQKVLPFTGVFAVKVYGLSKSPLPAIANLGSRPTVAGSKTLLEAHIFNYSETIYGEFIQIEFVKKIRDEQRFASLDLLKQQIQKDVEIARSYFKL